jgi:hypothetical protein
MQLSVFKTSPYHPANRKVLLVERISQVQKYFAKPFPLYGAGDIEVAGVYTPMYRLHSHQMNGHGDQNTA